MGTNLADFRILRIFCSCVSYCFNCLQSFTFCEDFNEYHEVNCFFPCLASEGLFKKIYEYSYLSKHDYLSCQAQCTSLILVARSILERTMMHVLFLIKFNDCALLMKQKIAEK